MPELPEVETERVRLAPRLEGRRIRQARIDDPRLTRPEEPEAVAASLEGARIEAVERRGKYLLMRIEDGRVLLVHLRMTGGFRYAPATHERAVVELDDGGRVAYRDQRRFGTWLLLDADEAERHLAVRLGPEPLEPSFTAGFLAGRLAGRRAPVKAAILDQRTVAGLGNIYADEALWHAKIDPRTPAGELAADQVAALRRGIRTALRAGIRYQGADLGDGTYAGGRMQQRFRAYGRTGEPCSRCGTPVEKTRVGGRGTWFCPCCQSRRGDIRARPETVVQTDASSSSSRPSRSS
jgi:formamidopyrimidine-DNA glycosylase